MIILSREQYEVKLEDGVFPEIPARSNSDKQMPYVQRESAHT